ncbi:2-carboxy-1,4-naphthoquinone phytyltransferase, chloroplastic isoform X2 [Elaeis guineensis]|uniref:2-carboxy-1,4-naphthoquinone phytyltransferase, chloroplastic isoform X2 n=1 Tax=Elaeis guineensis var. tenera TaxID=51953 RepID=A0A6I9R3N8_ELAGV|nr:2-carboxy-1,4-naphthoquinone phytyltransferase, chloroplastic isoform X2 [Elaeis guineensis]
MATALRSVPLLLSNPSPPPPPSLSRRTTTHPLRKGGKWAVTARKPWPPLWPRSSSQPTPEVALEGDADKISRATLLWRAAKLPIYSVALVPLTVGSAAAYLQTGIFFAKRYFVLLSASMLVITWLNLSNDVYDFDTGADRHKKESVVNIIGSRTVTQYAANISLVLGFMGLIWAFTEAGDIRFILLVAYAIACGYVYQCPPFRLSYQGLGEPLCFAAFGPFATTAFYFANSSKYLTSGISHLPLTGTVLSASVLVGLTTTLILFCSHFHQIDGDRAVGKMSPLVRIGTRAGSKVFLCALTLPMGKIVVDYVKENHNDNGKIFMAKYYCVRLHALFGMALALGLWLARAGNKA